MNIRLGILKQLVRRGKSFIIVSALTAAGWHCGAAAGAPAFRSDFDAGPQLQAGWTIQGSVAIDAGQTLDGNSSLRLSRTQAEFDSPCAAIGPRFAIKPGSWEVELGCKSDLTSPDSSYDGVVSIEYLAGDAVVGSAVVADVYGQHDWQPIAVKLQMPASATSARFRIEINKALGEFWVADLSAEFVSAVPEYSDPIAKLYFDSPQLGNLLYPDDPRVFRATVEAVRSLDPTQLKLTYIVRDYWGCEQTLPATVTLVRQPGLIDNRIAYAATVDLGRAPLEIGRYYRLDAVVPEPSGSPYRNYTSFAILPEAPANAFKPMQIPFSQRDWDDRIDDYITLSHRLGIRLCGLWSGWSADHPDEPSAPDIELCGKLGMGVICGVPTGAYEARSPGYLSYTEQVMREGTRDFIQRYGKVASPMILSLGNEPGGTPAQIAEDVKAYSWVYDEAKKTDPSIMVLGTSCGANEGFFKAGMGNFCDAYDMHDYEDWRTVPAGFKQYDALFKKYGNPRPVWSTELGLNSQGMSRYSVAAAMIMKCAAFFGSGGANMSWFDLLYPDPAGTGADSSGASFDVFDSRYVKYAPKLTAVIYYDLVNSILDKKIVDEKDYGDIHLYLFRDRSDHSLIVAWKDSGRQDISLPLPSVASVQMIQTNSRRSTLNAGGSGIALSITEDPALLLFDGACSLPKSLGAPSASVDKVPSGFVDGARAGITIALHGIASSAVNLIAPPFWQVTKENGAATGRPTVRFAVTAPASTMAQQAEFMVTVKSPRGGLSGELYERVPVLEPISARVVPVPPADGKGPGVKLIVANNGAQRTAIRWSLALDGQFTLKGGDYPELPDPAAASLTGSTSGVLSVPGGGAASVVCGLANVDSQNVYQVSAQLTDSAGLAIREERCVAGFIDVHKAKHRLSLDGALDDPAWKEASVERLDEARQYFTFNPTLAQWKGPSDLSGKVRFLWDDKYLYVGVDVTDDIAGGLQEDNMLWAMDGVQFLIDPARGAQQGVGKYDYAMAVGKRGPQAWCNLSPVGGATSGDAKDIVVAYKRKGDGTGAIKYEIAIPWARLAPFRPSLGADLGLTLILNDDDGKGRLSYMTWFGNANTKRLDTVGDLMLGP